MIFEFFKRIFWKADEGNRKRKASEMTMKSGEDQTLMKKCRYDFVSSNHVKIIHKSDKDSNYKCNQSRFNSSIHSRLDPKHFKIQMQNDKKFESLETVNLDSSFIKVSTSNTGNSAVKKEFINQSTLYNTQRLSERKQYSDMLLNFIASDTKSIEEMSKIVNQENQNENLSLHKPLLPNKYLESSSLQIHCKSPAFQNSHKCSKTQFQKCVLLNNADFGKIKYETPNKYINSVIRKPAIEVIKTNSLRDRLSSRPVIKKSFITQISEKYDGGIKQRYKEVEELKKLTYILSKHNRLSREIALEDHLSRSMRLCEVVLEEELSEERLTLPELSLGMKERIKFALSLGPADEILVEGFGLRITRKDIQTLAGLNWLNDEVINFYMNLLMVRSNNERYPSIYAMNTFFYPKLLSGGHSSLKRWTRKVDIFLKDLIVVPIHLGIHWCMSIIDFRSKCIQYFDSMGSPNYKCLQLLKQYLHEESIDKKKKPYDFHDWSFENVKDIPQQMNSSDCGVFSCMFAEYICSNKQINFNQDDMPYFRNKMVYEILTTQLL